MPKEDYKNFTKEKALEKIDKVLDKDYKGKPLVELKEMVEQIIDEREQEKIAKLQMTDDFNSLYVEDLKRRRHLTVIENRLLDHEERMLNEGKIVKYKK